MKFRSGKWGMSVVVDMGGGAAMPAPTGQAGSRSCFSAF